MTDTNNITKEQTNPEYVKLIRARDNTYSTAKWTQGMFVLASILLPAGSALASLNNLDGAKPYLALAGLILLLLDVAFLERLQKDRIKRGAKLQEEFDTKVLKLPWNKFVAGEAVSLEDVREASAKPLSAQREREIAAWYESFVSEVPLELGRLVCQRTNITYDSRLRRRYGNWLLILAILPIIILAFVAVTKDQKISELIMGIIVPFAPILNWALREHRKQSDTATSLKSLQSEIEKAWADAIEGATPEAMTARSRQLQDAIYQHRASAPLIFDWVYRRLRTKNEDEAHHAAKELVAQAKAALIQKEAA